MPLLLPAPSPPCHSCHLVCPVTNFVPQGVELFPAGITAVSWPYPEELKLEGELSATLELFWEAVGLLVWRPEPGDEGLLLFPGEQDDVTEGRERQNRQRSHCGSQTLCHGSSDLDPIFPHPAGSVSSPVFRGVGGSITGLLPAQALQSGMAGSASPRLARCKEVRCQNHLPEGHTQGWAHPAQSRRWEGKGRGSSEG